MLINDMQQEQHAWAVKNFGPPKLRWPALGVFEELGELAHWWLKQEQGIRGTPEDCIAKKKDAIGDCVIFALEYCSLQRWQVSSILPEHELTLAELQEHAKGCAPNWGFVADALHLLYNEDQHRQFHWSYSDMSQLFFNLAVLCNEQGWSLQDIAVETWTRVRARDWTKNKQNGGDTIDEDDKKLHEYLEFLQTDRGAAAMARVKDLVTYKKVAGLLVGPVVILSLQDPHTPSALYGYAESVHNGVPGQVPSDPKTADDVRAVADRFLDDEDTAEIKTPVSSDCPRSPPCGLRGFHAADECVPIGPPVRALAADEGVDIAEEDPERRHKA